MALITSPVIAQASGSIAGITFSHNRGGLYIRKKNTPTDPNTGFQAIVRGIVADLSNAWVNVLTQAQRDAWDLYAENVTVLSKIGTQIKLSGINHYLRSNTPRLQAGGPRVDDGPLIFDTGSFSPVAFTGITASNDFSIAFTEADEWVNEDDAFMIVYGSRPQNLSINFFKGPFRLNGTIAGDATTPPTSPQTVTNAFPFSPNQKLFGRFQVSRADGRLSNAQISPATAVV